MRTAHRPITAIPSRDLYRGKSIRVAGIWNENNIYYNDDFVVDLVIHDNNLYYCKEVSCTNICPEGSDKWVCIIKAPKIWYSEDKHTLCIENNGVLEEISVFDFEIKTEDGHLYWNDGTNSKDLGDVTAIHVGDTPPSETYKLWNDKSEQAYMSFDGFFIEGYNAVVQKHNTKEALKNTLDGMEECVSKTVPTIGAQVSEIQKDYLKGKDKNEISNTISEISSRLNSVQQMAEKATTEGQVKTIFDDEINKLSATKTGESTHLTVKITTSGGNISNVTVTGNDIASAADVESIKTKINPFFENNLDKKLDTLSEIQQHLKTSSTKMDEFETTVKNTTESLNTLTESTKNTSNVLTSFIYVGDTAPEDTNKLWLDTNK